MSNSRENELVFLIRNASHELNNYIHQAVNAGLQVELLVKTEQQGPQKTVKSIVPHITKVL